MEKTVRCTKCLKRFEVIGQVGRGTLVSQPVTCPYDECNEPNEVSWPMDRGFFIRKIPSQMP
jgi:hypothetical protein